VREVTESQSVAVELENGKLSERLGQPLECRAFIPPVVDCVPSFRRRGTYEAYAVAIVAGSSKCFDVMP
jgi:hypothetical protein